MSRHYLGTNTVEAVDIDICWSIKGKSEESLLDNLLLHSNTPLAIKVYWIFIAQLQERRFG